MSLPAPRNPPQSATPGLNVETRFPNPVGKPDYTHPCPGLVLPPTQTQQLQRHVMRHCRPVLILKGDNYLFFQEYFLCWTALASTDVPEPTDASQVNDFCASRLGFCITYQEIGFSFSPLHYLNLIPEPLGAPLPSLVVVNIPT